MGSSTRAAMFLCLTGVFCLTGAVALCAEEPHTAPAIMQKMAANTASATDARRQFVYRQRVRSSLRKSNAQVVCRESREYDVVPEESTTRKQLVAFSGECREGNHMAPYSPPAVVKPGLREKGTEEDHNGQAAERESIAGFIDDLANDSKSRDGIARQLFPLSAEELAHYTFSLKGETTINGRLAYDITFEPAARKGVCIDVGEEQSQTRLHVELGKDREKDQEEFGCRPWKGEAWIDAEDYQPVRIDTRLAKGIPWGVRVLMGLNIHQLGFSLNYQRVAPGVWFPSTYGTEFRFVVFWGYKRTVMLSMENSDFRKTDAQSKIQFESTQN
jgi:hypothetical protein